MQRTLHAHPFLIALYPVLSYWVENRNFVFLSETLRTTAVCLGLVGMLYLAFWTVSPNKQKAALLASLVATAYLYFGHIYYSINGISRFFAQPEIFLAAWIAWVLVALYLIIRIVQQGGGINLYLNWFSLILLLFPGLQVGLALATGQRLPLERGADLAAAPRDADTAVSDELPDIFYIVLDGYGRGDVLQELYAFDNQPFLEALAGYGFYVAGQSHANYASTYASISTALNGDYLDTAGLDLASEDRTIVRRYLSQSRHLRRLQELGYRIIAFRDADSLLRLDLADEIISYDGITLNNFELGFQALTLGKFWSPAFYEFTQWEIVRAQLAALQELPARSSHPRFVFAHLLSPHPPFVFKANGEFVATNLYMAGDGSDYGGTTEEYLAGYIGQVEYLNQRVLHIVAGWLRDRERPIVIILQGDHGPGAYLDWRSLQGTCLRERLPIFNAYYFSDPQARQGLYPSISPVNSLRVVFDQVLGQRTPLLPDRSFYATSARPFDFVDVTERRQSCRPLE